MIETRLPLPVPVGYERRGEPGRPPQPRPPKPKRIPPAPDMTLAAERARLPRIATPHEHHDDAEPAGRHAPASPTQSPDRVTRETSRPAPMLTREIARDGDDR